MGTIVKWKNEKREGSIRAGKRGKGCRDAEGKERGSLFINGVK